MVEVEHHHACRFAAAAAALHLQCQLFLDVGVLEQAGQAVAGQRGAQRAGTLGMRIDTGHQRAVADRLGDEIVAGLEQGGHLPVGVGFRRQVDDRHPQPLVMQADHLRQLRPRTVRHIDVQQHDLGVEAAHGVQHAGRFGEGLHLHLRVAQHQAVARRQLGVVVDDQHTEGLALLAVEAAFQAVFQLGNVQRADEEALGTGAHRGQLAGEVVAIVDHQQRQGLLQALLQRGQCIELAFMLDADDQRIGQLVGQGLLERGEIMPLADHVAEVAQGHRHAGGGDRVALHQVDAAARRRLFVVHRQRRCAFALLPGCLAGQLQQGGGEGIGGAAAGLGRVQPAIGALFELPGVVPEAGETEGPGRARQAMESLAHAQHQLAAAAGGAGLLQVTGERCQFCQVRLQAFAKLLLKLGELFLQRQAGTLIHARPPTPAAAGRPAAGGRRVCSTPGAHRAGAAPAAARAADGR